MLIVLSVTDLADNTLYEYPDEITLSCVDCITGILKVT